MAEATGIVGEFFALKEEVDADLLAMQCGDFYEFFGDDAETVSRELDLKVSQKSSGGVDYPMAGVPVDDLTPYLRALVERGYRVAIADQYETDDGHAREIVRVVTPGTLVETTDEAAVYLAALVEVDPGCIGVAFADVTTGRFRVTRLTGEDPRTEAIGLCHRFGPAEVLPGPTLRADDAFVERLREALEVEVTESDEEAFAPGRARRAVREQFGNEAIASLGLDTPELAAVRASGAVVRYIEDAGVGVLPAMTRLTPFDDGAYVSLDVTTQRTLELTEPMIEGGGSLLETIDHTVTAAGGRRLREWVTTPLSDRKELDRRQAAVGTLVETPLARERIHDTLAETGDLARLANRVGRRSADARTLVAIGRTLARLPRLAETIANDPELGDSPLADLLGELPQDKLGAIADRLEAALRPDPPRTVTEGELIREGYDDELDELIERHDAARSWVDGLAEREQESHGITHLQVDRNRTDGYYIQVGNSETDAVPDHYQELKTLKSSKRYTTEELEDREREILRLESARYEREYELFEGLREEIAADAPLLQDAGHALAQLDAFACLATHAAEQGWVRPSLAATGEPIEIEAGRHPVVETTTSFVPNGLSLDEDRRLLLVTGPNMSGKSTYLRQTALIVLLAQIGSFVPADDAHIGLVDGIYTRVGALDELSQGRSTFMVEMQELANILHSAEGASLVILDEVGRGTATYDGMSIAWAAMEYLHNEIGAKTMFATHYHELTELAEGLPGAANVHIAAEERDGEVTFLRTVREGSADRSYGIHVASLAGEPEPVRERARSVLRDLREDRRIEARGATESIQAVFDLADGTLRTNGRGADELPDTIEEVIEEIRAAAPEETPPIELARRVAEWQRRLPED